MAKTQYELNNGEGGVACSFLPSFEAVSQSQQTQGWVKSNEAVFCSLNCALRALWLPGQRDT